MERRNIAIVAHVDHGKTTLVDALLSQSGLFRDNQSVEERVMDSNDLEKERGITILSKIASVRYGDIKIQLVDTPGHADFGGEVERILRMVDGVLLLVDAAEGPMPQTRFVLERSLALGLKPIVVVNKVDRPDQRVEEVIDEVLDLFIDLGADDDQVDYPVVFASGRDGVACDELADFGNAENLEPMFKAICNHIPEPSADPDKPYAMLISNIEQSEFVGRQSIGLVEQGRLAKGDNIVCIGADDEVTGRVTKIEVFEGLGRKEVESVEAGDICVIAGFEKSQIGDTLTQVDDPQPLPRIEVSKPTVAMFFHVNDSPFAGLEGDHVTSRQIRDRLWREARYDQALEVTDTDKMETFRVAGRGELHLSILIEKMRREGYEFCVSRPQVLIREEDGKKLEPVEIAVADVPSDATGAVIERIGRRKGNMIDMKPQGNRSKLTFEVPTRGLIGFRTEFLSITKGEGILASQFKGYAPWTGAIEQRMKGVMISMEKTTTVPYAIFKLEDRGEFIIGSGVDVYAGMILGICNRPGDLVVNIGKGKQLTNVRASGSDEAVLLTPPIDLSLEGYLEFINDDEWIEVTPKNIRARKQILDHNLRKQDQKRRAAEV